MRRAASSTVLIGLGAVLVPSCRAPTEITLVLTTDVKCADLRGTSVTVGHLGEIETKAATTSSTFCDATTGDLGALVVVPSGAKSDEVAMKIVAGVGRDADSCVPPYGKGCIVARRAIHFLPHTALRIQAPLRAACDGVPCGETETCVAGQCTAAEITDPSACSGPDGCGEGALGTGGTDAGAGGDASADARTDASADAGDAATVPATYNDMTQAANWSAFDTINLTLYQGFEGAVLDGRYLYLVPSGGSVVLRYDTRASFTAAGSWTPFDTTTVNANANGFAGGAFDGRYVYFVPFDNGAMNGLVVRYDTQATFAAGSSWSVFDISTVNASAKGFMGATFDGRYLYFVPNSNTIPTPDGVVARYDTQAAFGAAASWSTFDAATLNANAKGFVGGAFDGRYVYLVPHNFNGQNTGYGGPVPRYDTQAPFPAAASWSTFSPTAVSANAGGFAGAAFDGRYVYFVPSTYAWAIVTRYDTQASFSTPAAWSTFDTRTLSPSVTQFMGATFDGRYVYFATNGAAPAVRYDTQGSFTVAGSWSTFDVRTVSSTAGGFEGSAFDGRYVYFVPGIGGFSVVVRFDAKSPPSMPNLPGFSGSFL